MARNVTFIADDLIQAGTLTTPIRDNLVSLIADGVCSSFDSGNGDPLDVDAQAQKAVDSLSGLSDFTAVQLVDIKDNFSTQFQEIDGQVDSILDSVQDYARISYYAIGMISLGAFLYIGAYVAWFGPQRYTISTKTYFVIQTWIILPLYLLTLILTAIFASAIGTSLVVNAGK